MSKASRLFRFRAHRETTLSTLLPAISLPPKSADLSNDSHESADTTTDNEPFASCATFIATDSLPHAPAQPWALADALPHAIAAPLLDAADASDPLVILQQTIEPATRANKLFVAASPLDSVLHKGNFLSSANETDSAVLVATKGHREVSVPRTFLTETMDLEAIAASAREAAATAGTRPGATNTHQLTAPETAKEQIVAEVSAVAEEFVAEQQHHAQPESPRSHSVAPEPPKDRRRRRRAMISAPIRVRGINTTGGLEEIASTVDVSRTGILFHSPLEAYTRGMEVAVVFPYSQAASAIHIEQTGLVVRINDLGDGIRAVAVALCAPASENFSVTNVSAGVSQPDRPASSTASQTTKPMILAVDADETLRDTVKTYLQNEGYDVIAVGNAADAREVLNIFTPALVIAEVEGEDTPGYDLCAYVKSNPALQQVPVVLTTSSAYPSDYSSAHSRGAIVCMAKPYKQERLAHVVRLLAPLPEHLQNNVAPHAADPTRLPGRDCNGSSRNLRLVRSSGSGNKSNSSSNGKIRFKFPSFR